MFRKNNKKDWSSMNLDKLNEQVLADLGFGKITDEKIKIQQANKIMKRVLESNKKYVMPEKRQKFLTNGEALINSTSYVADKKSVDGKRFDTFARNLFNAEIDTIVEATELDK